MKPTDLVARGCDAWPVSTRRPTASNFTTRDPKFPSSLPPEEGGAVRAPGCARTARSIHTAPPRTCPAPRRRTRPLVRTTSWLARHTRCGQFSQFDPGVALGDDSDEEFDAGPGTPLAYEAPDGRLDSRGCERRELLREVRGY